jgi:ribonuclease HI
MTETETNSATVRIWTAGACIPNPGPGGWAYFARLGDRERTGKGHHEQTTCSRMQMTAAVEALRSLKLKDIPAVVYSDSQMLVKGMNEWLSGWIARGWRRSDGKPVLNADLWQELSGLVEEREPAAAIRFSWISGRAEEAENELVHDLAERRARSVRDPRSRSLQHSLQTSSPVLEVSSFSV